MTTEASVSDSAHDSDCECVDQLAFEALLSNLSARFINLPADQVDQEIKDAQRQVCEFLGLDLSALWQWEHNEPDSLVLTHLYRPLGGPPVPERMEASVHHPWALAEMKAGRPVILFSTEEVPPGAEQDREVWRHYGIKTNLAVPLKSAAGLPCGAVSFNDMRRERRVWTDCLIKRLTLVADVFSNALIKKQLEQKLRYSNAKLQLAADSAGAGIWSLNLETRVFWATEKAWDLFGFTVDEEISVERFFSLIHPEDLNDVQQALEEMEQTDHTCQVEYRVVKPDGDIRRMTSRGRRRCQVPGEASCVIMGVTVDITDQKNKEQQLQIALKEVRKLKDQLKEENSYLREQLKRDDGLDMIIGEHESVLEMIASARQVSATDATVMITGETGTGKELLAQAIHDMSSRSGRTMVRVNCAALPASLIEGELFGREKGAYTGAMTRQAGRFEVANHSTIFLDEVGEMPLELQAKLLHVLQNGCFERLGSCDTIHTDARVITATNRDLLKMVSEGTFREDLYHRLNVFPIHVPALRERADDIPLLVWKCIEEFNSDMGRSIEKVCKPTMKQLREYPWPGNVRELRNVIERAMIISEGNTLQVTLSLSQTGRDPESLTLESVEHRHILKVLEKTHWKIGGKGGAADLLGLERTTLNSRMKKLGIMRPAS